MQIAIPQIAVLFAAAVLMVAAAPLVEPTVIKPDDRGVTTVTLTVDAARITIAGVATFTTRAYHVDGTVAWPGPTLQVRPGGTLIMRLLNKLGADIPNTAATHNTFHSLNTTNIHTHGLHVDPFIDSVFVKVAPGGETTYTMPIPANHAPGLHWYHGHVHGSTTLQVMSGLAGAIVVESPAGAVGLPTELSSLTSHIALVHSVLLSPETNQQTGGVTQACDAAQPNFNPFKIYTLDEIATEAGSPMKTNAVLLQQNAHIFFVNGQVLPSIAMAPGERRIVRIVWGSAARRAELSIGGGGCTLHAIAFDGVYITGAPRLLTTIGVLTATRLDLVVTCPTAGTYTLQANTAGRVDVMTFAVSGTAVTTPALPTTLNTITRPSYLASLLDTTVTKTHSIHFSQGNRPSNCQSHFGQGSDCTRFDLAPNEGGSVPSATDPTCPFKPYGGERGTTAADVSKYEFVAQQEDTAEWTVHGLGNEPHPLHIHVNHFQIVSYTAIGTNDNSALYFQVGDWRDTLPALGGRIKIRMKFADFHGETVVHCHFVPHEDRGLMTTFLIQPSASSTTAAQTPAVITTTGALTTTAASTTGATTQQPPPTTQTPAPATSNPVPTPTPRPVMCALADVERVGASFRIAGSSFAPLLQGDKLTQLSTAVRRDISTLIGVSEETLCIASLSLGSLIVSFTSTAPIDAAAAAVAIASSSPSSWLTSTSALYTANGGNTAEFVVSGVEMRSSATPLIVSLSLVLSLLMILVAL